MNANDCYQIEIESFKKAFADFMKKRIIIYGIGRRTATLVPYLPDFTIVGLMDRDPDNIGKIMYNLPVVSLETAENTADVIIINAPQSYWEIIYKRIQTSRIPVYYCNGIQAELSTKQTLYTNHDYWNKSASNLYENAEKYEFISFDLFDTLIMRKVYMPQDVWNIVERKWLQEKKREINFSQLRKQAISATTIPYPDIYDIYHTLQTISGLAQEDIDLLIKWELTIEEDIIVPRTEMIELFKTLLASGKTVYILSDMYLSYEFLMGILHKYGIAIEGSRFWVSCKIKADKNSGSMWEKYKREVVGKHKALHIGDSLQVDIANAKKQGIDAYYVMSAADMISNSSVQKMVPQVCSEFASAIMGLVISHSMNDPFALSQLKGKMHFDSEFDLGYGLFGPVIYTYLRWIEEKAATKKVDKLYFLARDGYFLYQDYQYLSEIRGYGIPCDYLETSRRSVMVPSIQTAEDLKDVIKFPYNGTFSDFLEDRFSLEADERTADDNDKWISTVSDYELVYNLCLKYTNEIQQEILSERKSYLEYVTAKEFHSNAGVVDLFFYGNTQYFLSKLLNRRLTGFYIACDLTSGNRCKENNSLYPCFQDERDEKAVNCNILKKCLLLESFLTAPNGMLLKIDDSGNFIHGVNGKNQTYFKNREVINNGVKKFIQDASHLLSGEEKLDTEFVDHFYGELLDDQMELSEKLKEIFYFDNALIQRREMKIIE